jgi:hypothetical protein
VELRVLNREARQARPPNRLDYALRNLGEEIMCLKACRQAFPSQLLDVPLQLDRQGLARSMGRFPLLGGRTAPTSFLETPLPKPGLILQNQGFVHDDDYEKALRNSHNRLSHILIFLNILVSFPIGKVYGSWRSLLRSTGSPLKRRLR